ncbi:MAG: BatD family protein [Helicobacteraceae bacterium]|nr:BatD family protein [Helicobacteraceae bacterium]
MKNLGKIFFITFCIPYFLQAQVIATLDATNVEEGELVTLSLEIIGENPKKPDIYTLCGSDVVATGQQTSLQMLNGKTSKSYILSYQFFPTKSCEIEPIEVRVNGQIEKSNSLSLKVLPSDTSKERDFILTLESDKKEVYIGEPFEVTLLFKQKKGLSVVDSNFVGPNLQGFWMQGEPEQEQYSDGEYSVTKLRYKMSAQRDANLSITPAQIKIATRSHARDVWGAFSPRVKWKTYRSNGLDIDVKPLPTGVKLVGSFEISASVDKDEINANEAVNLTVSVKGQGNLEDISSFKPFVQNVSVFDEKIDLKDRVLTQKIAFVADDDFVIPSLELRYFDLDSKEIKTLKTQEIPIKVNNSSPQEKMVIKKEIPTQEQTQEKVVTVIQTSYFTLAASFILGFFIAFLLLYFKPWNLRKQKNNVSLNDEKMLLVKLLPYKEDEEVAELVRLLEENIYSNKSHIIEKKRLKEIVKKYL